MILFKQFFIIQVLIIILPISSLGQNNTIKNESKEWIDVIPNSKWNSHIVDVDEFVRTSKKDNKMFHIKIIRVLNNITAYKNIKPLQADSSLLVPDIRFVCLPNFNVANMELSIIQSEYVTPGRCQVKYNGQTKQTEPRSMLFLCVNHGLDSIIRKNTADLYLSEYSTQKDTLTYFSLLEIKSEEDFCWKLQQLIYFLNAIPEPVQVAKKISRNSINLNTGFATQISSQFSSIAFNSNYNSIQYELNGMNNYNINLAKRINNPDRSKDTAVFNIIKTIKVYNPVRISLGIDYTYSTQEITGSAEQIQDQFIADNSSGLSAINVYASDVKENFKISNHRLGAELRLEKEHNSNTTDGGFKFYSYGVSVIPYAIIGSYFDASIISGEFSYKGKVDGVTDELENIPSLGLKNNVSLSTSRTSAGIFSGYGGSLRPFISFGNQDIGFTVFSFASLESLTNKGKFSGEYTITKNSNNYTPSLLNLKSFRTTNFGVGFSLQFYIGS